MKKKKIIIFTSIYTIAIAVIGLCGFFIANGINKYVDNKIEVKDVVEDSFNEILDGDIVPVMNSDMIIKPYLDENVSVGKSYYDFKGEESNQENSLIFYNNIYMQNNGVEYISNDSFDVVSILDGEVIGIEDSEIYGKILTIKHNDNLVSVYSNLDNVIVSIGYNVNQGEIIASSRVSSLSSDNMLHFEVYYKGNTINPESLYSLKVSDFQ